MDKPHDHPLIADAITAVQALGLEIELMPFEAGREQQADGLLRIRFGEQDAYYLAEVKRGLRPATLGATILQLERLGEQALLVTDYVTPQLADELRARGVDFIDTAGNAYLHKPPLLVWVKGQRPRVKPALMRVTGRAFQATGLHVVFAMLCHP